MKKNSWETLPWLIQVAAVVFKSGLTQTHGQTVTPQNPHLFLPPSKPASLLPSQGLVRVFFFTDYLQERLLISRKQEVSTGPTYPSSVALPLAARKTVFPPVPPPSWGLLPLRLAAGSSSPATSATSDGHVSVLTSQWFLSSICPFTSFLKDFFTPWLLPHPHLFLPSLPGQASI